MKTGTSWFAPKLRRALDQEAMTVRALARTWRPDVELETSRRSIYRYLHNGVVPSPQIRRELADAIGVDHSELELSADDEEESEVSFDDFLRRRVRKEIAKAIAEELGVVRQAVGR